MVLFFCRARYSCTNIHSRKKQLNLMKICNTGTNYINWVPSSRKMNRQVEKRVYHLGVLEKVFVQQIEFNFLVS